MGRFDGCLTMGRFLVAMLLAGLTMAVLALVSGFPVLSQPKAPHNDGGTMTSNPHPAIPPVSDRHFSFGTTHAIATGDVSLEMNLPVDRDKAYAQDGLAWIAFGAPGDPRAVLVSLDEPENSVAISSGGETALGVGSQCVFDITVTDEQVSGRIQCANADARRGGKKVGSTSIEVSFTASS